MGVLFCFARLGSTLNTFLTPKLYSINNSLVLPLFGGVIALVILLFNAIIIFMIDRRAEKQE